MPLLDPLLLEDVTSPELDEPPDPPGPELFPASHAEIARAVVTKNKLKVMRIQADYRDCSARAIYREHAVRPTEFLAGTEPLVVPEPQAFFERVFVRELHLTPDLP